MTQGETTCFGLDEAKAGLSYKIISNSAAGRTRMRLDSMGLVTGEVIHVLFYNFSGQIVAIKGSRLAVSKELASKILVCEFDRSAGDEESR